MRVVAGRLGGRTLVAPRGHGTRPTPDRVREALFSILGPLDGARVLDLFAGTGALGIEAVSRGAVHATFVEQAKAALDALRENVAKLGLGQEATILAARVERAARPLSAAGPFDLILADPPYADVRDGSALRALEGLVAAGVLRLGGRLVLEHATADPAPDVAGLEPEQTRTYGDTSLAFYVRASELPSGSPPG